MAALFDPALLVEVEQFLYEEARRLDEQRHEDWLALYTADCTYWVPLERDQADALHTSSIIHDDRTLLEVRVRQYGHRSAHSRRPFARTVHQVANVALRAVTVDEIVVGSTLVLVEYRAERQRVWGATVEHRLRRTSEGLRIAAKRVDLVNSESELDGIAFLF